MTLMIRILNSKLTAMPKPYSGIIPMKRPI